MSDVWGPSCPWKPEYAGMGIPDFLVISPEQRKINWATVAVTDQRTGLTVNAIDERLARDKANRLAAEREKNAKGLERLKRSHPGERYDRKTKQWVHDTSHAIGDGSELSPAPNRKDD